LDLVIINHGVLLLEVLVFGCRKYLDINFDPPSSIWNSNSTTMQESGNVNLTFLNNNIRVSYTNNTILTQYTNDSFLDSEFYIIFSYDISTKNIKSSRV
jgi:hypothetical protein